MLMYSTVVGLPPAPADSAAIAGLARTLASAFRTGFNVFVTWDPDSVKYRPPPQSTLDYAIHREVTTECRGRSNRLCC